jgi:hypothetical protein
MPHFISQGFQQVIGRAILDNSFRQALLSNPGAVAGGMNLTPQEAQALSRLTPQQLDGLFRSVHSNLGGFDKALVDFLHKGSMSDLFHKDEFIIKLLGDSSHKEFLFHKMLNDSLVKGEIKFLDGYKMLGEYKLLGDSMVKGELNFLEQEGNWLKALGDSFYKETSFIKILGNSMVKGEFKFFMDGGGGPQRRSASFNVLGILIGLLVGILIGLLLFLPAPTFGQMVPTSGEIPACPTEGVIAIMPIDEQGVVAPIDDQGGDSLPGLFGFWNDARMAVGSDPLCSKQEGEPSQGGNQTDVGGGQPGGQTGGNPTGGQTSSGQTSQDCKCNGVDFMCYNPDGSVASASYNSAQCGGSGICECRGDDKALACPDGTYAPFNPQCGVGEGGGVCTCVANPACAQYPQGQCPDPENICKETGVSC